MGDYYSIASFTSKPSLGYLVRRSTTLLTDMAERAFAVRGIPFTQWLTLMKLRDNSPQSAGELACAIGHDQGALTRVVDALVEAGLVDRKRSQADRRRVEVRLTAAGQHYVDAQLPFVVDGTNQLLEVFTNEEIDTFLGLLTRLVARLETFRVDEARHLAVSPQSKLGGKLGGKPRGKPGRKP